MGGDHLIPNTTQIPNVVLDLLMPFLNDGEARVLMYLCRRTYGFQRESDGVSRSQFTHGIRSEGRQLDFGAGVSRQGAMNALEVLKAFGVVEQLSGGQGRGNIPVYRLNIKCEMVQWLDLMAQEPNSAREKIVQKLDLLRKKGLPYGPFSKKARNGKGSTEKVKDLDLSEKGLNRSKKGLTVRPTKPSSTKPRKDLSPIIPSHAETPPLLPAFGERSRKGYDEYPLFLDLWDIAVTRPTGSKGSKQESWHWWKVYHLEDDPAMAEQVIAAYRYQKSTKKWQENSGEYVPELQRWIKGKRWEGVEQTVSTKHPDGTVELSL